MNNILTLISLGKVAEATRYEVLLNRLIEEGEVWELNNLLDITKKIWKDIRTTKIVIIKKYLEI